MSQSPIKESTAKLVGTLPTARSGSSSSKNEIKISAEGVAKLTFSFLDDHHADSSLEPGEVKTPPHGSNASPSPHSFIKEVPSRFSQVTPDAALHNEIAPPIAMKRTKTTSQSDAQACQEKVRAILELDAIKRREDAEKKKQLQDAKQGGSEDVEDKESKRKAKEEKKRLKKIKKEEKKVALELYSEDENYETNITILTKMKKKKRDKESYSSEEEGENHDDDDDDQLCSIGTTVPLSTAPRYAVVSAGPMPPHLPPFPDQFIGYRPMNPFMRMPRPDFHHQRGSGGFHMRGRGGMRGAMRFPGFRPPFHGGGPPRHIINAIPRQQTPPPARGHSPILAPPSDNLIWTTTKPSISYAFTTRDNSKTKLLSKPVGRELSPITKTECTQNISLQISENTIRKKLKKSREHVKKRRTSRNSCEKLGKHKMDKSHISRSSSERKRTKTPEMQFMKTASKTIRKQSNDFIEIRAKKKPKFEQATDDSEEMWDADELPISTPPHSASPAFQLIKNTSKSTKESHISDEENISNPKISASELLDENVIPEGPALPPQIDNETSADTDDLDHGKNFDMFADSPPRPLTPPLKPSAKDIDKLLLTARKAADDKSEQKHIKKSVEIDDKAIDTAGSSTPPKALLKDYSKIDLEKSSVQKAIEIQSQMNAQLKASALKSSKIKSKSLHEENAALLKAIEAKNRINKLLNEDVSISPGTSKPKIKSVFDVQKTSLQKAIEAQSRIDELLRDDDLDSSAISIIKAKSLEHKRQKEKEAQSGSKQQHEKHEKSVEKKQSKTRRSFTPELQNVRPKNPFKRSISREWHKERRSRSRDPKRANFDKYRNDFRRSKSRLRGGSSTSFNRSSSFNRSRSTDKDRDDKRQRPRVDTKRSRSPHILRGASKDKSKSFTVRGKEKPSSSLPPQKKKNRVPLSFTAAEFLFPEDDDNNEDDSSKSSSQKVFFAEDDTSSEKPRNLAKKAKSHKDDSPDTDDYMDNWENDDVDLDINSNNACDSSTPMRSSSQEDVDEEKFVARFVNPSPPLFLQSLKETTANDQPLITNLSETREANNPKTKLENDQPVSNEQTQKKELFGMQEIYDQFIKSVEESGVDLQSTESNKKTQKDIIKDSVSVKQEDHLSTSSTSTSSSTSSSSCSSSSEGSNSSTSSDSSSSSSASSSEESNDADSFKNITLDSPKPKPKEVKTKPVVVVKIEKQTPLTPPLPTEKSVTPEREAPVIVSDIPKATATNKSVSPTVKDSVQPKPSPVKTENSTVLTTTTATTPTVKSQKSDVAKDFKKLKSLEANLSRIQMMRANYDSADEISDELLKMEKLFLHEKNLILQKYAKSSKTPATESKIINTTPPTEPSGQFVASLQESAGEAEQEATIAGDNKIFDANREAIKLTISPIKLPRTPAIFAKATNADGESHPTEPDEPDFTEKLQKPAKEVAIVKPMMETKELRSSQPRQHRRSTPPRIRSPSSGYHRDRRRSTSRSRYSPQQRRQQRGRSLSVSPPPRRGCAPARYLSPTRRGAGNAFSTNQSRSYRNTGRRSRSRSRSSTRQGIRRGNDRSRRATATTQVGHSQSHYRKSTTQQQRSATRDSRSRSRTPLRSPATPRSPPRPHSPRSPRSSPSSRRRSYSRERYSSRSPLPFKPPSPPMRRSLSPNLQRRLSLSPEKRQRDSSGIRRSRSHSRSRSPSIRYDDQRRHRSSSYDRRSPSLQSQYFLQDPSNGTESSASSSYYYNLSPNRISLDARINIVLNGPPNQEGNNTASFDSYTNYSQYGGQYMSIPPHPDGNTYGINYAGNQYVAMSSSDLSHPSTLAHQQVYSNIPTIGGSAGMSTHIAHSNYYYNEFSGHTNGHQPSPVLKELPKATVAVQKGNVLEIVPSTEMSERIEPTTAAQNANALTPLKQAKVKKPKKTLSWKEEVNNRHVTAAVLRLSRENESASKGILKKTSLENVSSNEDKIVKKKVYFEDGIFPNRESDDEDRKIIDDKLRRKLRRLHKLHGITIKTINLVKEHKRDDDKIVDPTLENATPPPPPPGTPAPNLEQPIYLRPPSPTPLFYFHFDSVVHSMYVSQLERPIPPRLLNPKAVPPIATGPSAQSPSNTQSPNGAAATSAVAVGAAAAGTTNLQGSKKELSTLAAMNRSNRASNNERSSPKMLPPTSSATSQRQANIKTLSIEATHSETHQTMIKNSFHAIPANISNTLPPSHMSPPMTPMPTQRQSSPIGFMGMRINNFMRLPPSPLAARHGGSPLPPNNGGPAMAVVGMRHSFNMPPPSMMPPQHMSPSPEFSPQQQQHYHPMSHPNSPHMHHLNQPYPVAQPPMPHNHQHPHPHFTPTGPPGPQAPPHHMYHHHHHHRHPSPQFYMQSLPPPPPLPPPSRHTFVPPPDAAPPVGDEVSTGLANSPQAMVSPYNMQRQ